MPTFVIAETAEDGSSDGTDEYVLPADGVFGSIYVGDFSSTLHDWAGIWRGTGIPQGATILTATVSWVRQGTDYAATPGGAWFGFAVDTPTDFSAADVHRISDHHARTTATVTHNVANNNPEVSPSLVTIIQEIVDRAGFGGDIGLTWRSDGDTFGAEWFNVGDFSDGNPASLTVTWDEGTTTPSSSDTGTAAEAVSGIALSAQTEAGTGTDAVGGVALSAQTEAGTSTDAVTGIALPTTEPGTFAEVVAIALASAESGTFSEATELDTGETTTPSDSDTGTLAELATVAVTLSQAETGTLLETIVGIALASSDEFGQEELVEGTEPITAVEGQTIALSTQTESGTLAETLALALSTAEAATLGEAPALAVSYSVTESGTFTEATLVQQGESNPVDAEAGTFGEFASVAVAVLDGDTGTASEGPAITASYTSAETAALIESGGLLNFTGIAGGILSVSARAHGSLGIEA